MHCSRGSKTVVVTVVDVVGVVLDVAVVLVVGVVDVVSVVDVVGVVLVVAVVLEVGVVDVVSVVDVVGVVLDVAVVVAVVVCVLSWAKVGVVLVCTQPDANCASSIASDKVCVSSICPSALQRALSVIAIAP